jgi:hypothetical protein
MKFFEFLFVENSLFVIGILPSSLHLDYLFFSHLGILQNFIRSNIARLLSKDFSLIFLITVSQFLHSQSKVFRLRYKIYKANIWSTILML